MLSNALGHEPSVVSLPFRLTLKHVLCKRQITLYLQHGLWQAVEADNLLDVRKLVNLWCRVSIEKVIIKYFFTH